MATTRIAQAATKRPTKAAQAAAALAQAQADEAQAQALALIAQAQADEAQGEQDTPPANEGEGEPAPQAEKVTPAQAQAAADSLIRALIGERAADAAAPIGEGIAQALRAVASNKRSEVILTAVNGVSMSALMASPQDPATALAAAQVGADLLALSLALPSASAAAKSDPLPRVVRFATHSLALAAASLAHQRELWGMFDSLTPAQVAQVMPLAEKAWADLTEKAQGERIGALVGTTGTRAAIARDYRPFDGRAVTTSHNGTTWQGTVIAQGDAEKVLIRVAQGEKSSDLNPTAARLALTGEKATRGPLMWILGEGEGAGTPLGAAALVPSDEAQAQAQG